VRVGRLCGVRELAPAPIAVHEREQAPALQSAEVRTIWRALTNFLKDMAHPAGLWGLLSWGFHSGANMGELENMKAIQIAAILSIYALACNLPALGTDWEQAETGLGLLTYFPWVLLNPFWYANPIFFAGCLVLALGNQRLASGLGLVASALAVCFACLIRFEEIQPGFVLWMASMFGLAMAGLANRTERSQMARFAGSVALS
jgi:hypothetical protein